MGILADLTFLLRNRHHGTWQIRELLRWTAKRTITIPGLLSQLLSADNLRRKGASVGTIVAVGNVMINGPRRNLSIGSFSAIGKAELATHDVLTIGKSVVINDGARILTASHDIASSSFALRKAPVAIDDYAWICTGATILPGVRVGRGAVVGAGCVLSKSVPPYALAVGNPARIVENRRSMHLAYYPSCLTAPFEAWVGKDRISVVAMEAVECG